jgi:acetyl-CoA acetyltransferase
MKDIAIIGFAQAKNVRREPARSETELISPVITEALEMAHLQRQDMDFTISASTDYVSGIPFSFVRALDAVGAWPPIPESHVEMDGAWGFQEAWVRLQHGDMDTALIYSFGNSSTANELIDVLGLQMDPYTIAPLRPDAISLAALQAQALLDAGKYTERDFAQVASRSRSDAKSNPYAQVKGDHSIDDILAQPYIASPLRKHDCPPITDGGAAMILATGDRARELCKRPVWIRSIDHRIEAHQPGLRNLAVSTSTKLAAEKCGVGKDKIDVAEIYAPYSHQELILRDALNLEAGTSINPSGGALAAHPLMSAGLIRVGEVAKRIMAGGADRGLAHATSGSCLQQNLVTVLEGA